MDTHTEPGPEPWQMNITFPKGVEGLFDTGDARRVLEAPVREGFMRLRCRLCGYPGGDLGPELAKVVDDGEMELLMTRAHVCRMCGMLCVRPAREHGFWEVKAPRE